MISKKLFDKLVNQINFEFFSAHIYVAMAAYFSSADLPGFANFFIVQAEEERFHAMKFFNYVNDMEGTVRIEGMEDPKNDYSSPLEAFKHALEHEKIVTGRIYELMDIATQEHEHATISLLKWFVDEQVEEESSMSTIIKKLQRIQDNAQAVYVLDAELAQRVFTPPANA